MANDQLDPKKLPTKEEERKQLAHKLRTEALEAFRANQPLVASLKVSDAVMLGPNDRDSLDAFDEIVFKTQDPLSLFPVATGAIHVATAAGRARVLMITKHLAEAIELLGRVLEVAPDLEYLDWMRRWLQPHVVPNLGWDLLMGSVVKPALTMAIRVPVPPSPKDPRLPNLRSAAEIFPALITHFPNEKVLYFGASAVKRRLGDTAATLQAADEGVRRFPDDWGLRAALCNALCDAGRPDDALQHARKAMEIDPQDCAVLHDVAQGYLKAGRADQAANLFGELLQRDPRYPNAQACLHLARFKAFNSEEDRRALLMLRDRKWWNDELVGMADGVDPPVPYFTALPGPTDATAHYTRDMVDEFGELLRCCGQGAAIEVTIRSKWPESPSSAIAFDQAMRAAGAGSAKMYVEVEQAQNPDPRADKGRLAFPIFQFDGRTVRPLATYADPNVAHAVGGLAYQMFRRDVWDPAAHQVAQQFGPNAAQAFLAVLANPPPPPQDIDGVTWMYRCQLAVAVIVSHFGPWESGAGRAALLSMVSGPSDWVTTAGIVALAWRALDAPQVRADVEGIFGWLRTLISPEGFTPWEGALVEAWLGIGGHPDATRTNLEQWKKVYEETLDSKNVVQTQRRYAGMTIEEYAKLQSDRPGTHVREWNEALNANPALMEMFVEAKREYELGKMGVSGDEKQALDQIVGGNMDMHLRMAQAQEAQRQVAQGGPDAGDPDPLVFPGQRVAKLSDYVRILKGMQTGNMMGALAQYGLDMMSYGQVAQAWAAKMAADPVLTEKFSQMMK